MKGSKIRTTGITIILLFSISLLAIFIETEISKKKIAGKKEEERVELLKNRETLVSNLSGNEEAYRYIELYSKVSGYRSKRVKEISETQQRIAHEERVKRLEKERLKREEEKKKQILASRGGSYKGVNKSVGVFNTSWYGSDCAGCSGQTASGVWVNKSIYYQGYGIAASDWNVIPPYSIIEVEGYGRYIVLDKGGAIKGKRLDLLTTSEAKSREFGRQHLNVKVLRWGKNKAK